MERTRRSSANHMSLILGGWKDRVQRAIQGSREAGAMCRERVYGKGGEATDMN